MSGRITKQELHSSVNNELDKIKENKDEIDVLSDDFESHKEDYESFIQNDYNPFKNSKGEPDGLAPLDGSGNIPESFLGNLDTGVKVVKGSYSGNGSSSQNISLGFRPSFVYILAGAGFDGWTLIDSATRALCHLGTTHRSRSSIFITSNGFRVGDGSSNAEEANFTNADYYYFAIKG